MRTVKENAERLIKLDCRHPLSRLPFSGGVGWQQGYRGARLPAPITTTTPTAAPGLLRRLRTLEGWGCFHAPGGALEASSTVPWGARPRTNEFEHCWREWERLEEETFLPHPERARGGLMVYCEEVGGFFLVPGYLVTPAQLQEVMH